MAVTPLTVTTYTDAIELGHLNDTTIARTAAGRVAIEGAGVITSREVAALTAKPSAVDADVLTLFDSAASGAAKKFTLADLKTIMLALIVASAPGTLDTLDELAAALGDDANFATTVTTALAAKQAKVMTGTVGTVAATSTKTVTLNSPWASVTPTAGDEIYLTWTNGNTAGSLTLAVNGGSAYPLSTPSGSTAAGEHVIGAGYATRYTFTGTHWLNNSTLPTMAEISEVDTVNPAGASLRFMTGRRLAYLKRKSIATAVTSSATPALSLDLGDWSTIAVGHNITAITTSGTGHDLQTVNLKLVGTGAYTLAFGSTWNFGFGVSAPASVASAKAIYIFGRWNSTTSKIDVIDVKVEA